MEFGNFGGGVFWERLDLDSEKKLEFGHLGGGVCSGKGQIWTQGKKLEFGNFSGVLCQVKTQSTKIWLNFNGEGGGCSGPNFRTGCSAQFEHKICLATLWKSLHHR